jgi:hypothetical protein
VPRRLADAVGLFETPEGCFTNDPRCSARESPWSASGDYFRMEKNGEISSKLIEPVFGARFTTREFRTSKT